jgi:acetylornithine/N-succinyldiaminopimelate aminotransferase
MIAISALRPARLPVAAVRCTMLTQPGREIEYASVPPAEAARFILRTIRPNARRTNERARVVTSHLLPTYARVDLAFERGEGAWLIGTDGERYLDFTGGVAVNALGHAHPYLIEALNAQAHKVWHVSNLFRIPEAERLAERLCAATFADLVFFCNSGAEAMEASIKVARKYQFVSGHPERYRIITFEGAFHGRTLATLAAGGQKKYLEGFGPVVEGFDQVPFGDFAAVKHAVGPETAAILIEPIQGEGGVRVVPTPFLRGLRELCDTQGLLLVFDEVQTGMGRTGSFFAHQRCGVTPDVMGVAKALGGGFPVGACLATAEAGKGMTAGTHGSTFGGNPLAMAVGNAVLDVMLAPGFLENVQRSAILFRQSLAEIRDRHPGVISEVRGEGLLIGLVAGCPNGELVEALRGEKLLAAAAGDNVVRMLPPLIINEPEIAEAVHRVGNAAAKIEKLQRERAVAGETAS